MLQHVPNFPYNIITLNITYIITYIITISNDNYTNSYDLFLIVELLNVNSNF